MKIELLNLLSNSIIPLVGVWLGYFVTKNSHIFQRRYDRKSDLLIDLYKEVVRLEFELKKYVHFVGADMKTESIDEKRKSLNNIKDNFQQFQHKFWEVEIILDNSSINEINMFLKKYIEITSKLTVANIQHQQGDHNQSIDNWDKSFELVKSDLSKIKNELKKEFIKTLKT